MSLYEYPQIDSEATVETQLLQIKSYLFKLTDALNYNQGNQAATKIFKEAATALKSSDVQELELQRIRESQTLRAAVLEVAAGVLTCTGTYYTDNAQGEAQASNIVNIAGKQFTVAGLALAVVEKLAELEKEIKGLKGE